MSGPVNINKATSHKIHTELGISKTKSHAIIEARKKSNGQLTMDDLKNIFKPHFNFVEFLVETGAIEFGSPWVGNKSSHVLSNDDGNAPSMHLASDVTKVLLSTRGLCPPASELSEGATSVSVIGDADQGLGQWKWVNIPELVDSFKRGRNVVERMHVALICEEAVFEDDIEQSGR